ncbi:MAG: T9SS type A sorting domain-containing protein [Bacteroidota bacterium]
MLGIDELLGTDDELSDPAHITFTTVESLLAGGWEYGDFQVFPNPASNRVHVSLPGEVAGATLRIIDHTGKIISTAIITGNSVEMNLQELSDGLYFIDVVSENFKARKKLLIAR